MRNKTIQTTQQKNSRRVQSNEKVIGYLSTKKLRDLLLNNCIGEGGQEYCQDTIERILSKRAAQTPKEDTKGLPTWDECFTECANVHDTACHGISHLVENCVFALELKSAFESHGYVGALELATQRGQDLFQIYRDEQDEQTLALCLSEFQ
jgi:hypothetical protein